MLLPSDQRKRMVQQRAQPFNVSLTKGAPGGQYCETKAARRTTVYAALKVARLLRYRELSKLWALQNLALKNGVCQNHPN